MIIVSQNKTEIINFDNVITIATDTGNTKKRISAICKDIKIFIGEYATEERAKEVLQEIAKTYRAIIVYGINRFYLEIYEMPKE